MLAAFGAVALATLLVGLLESLGRPSLAALGVAAGLAGRAARPARPGLPFPGAAMLAGGALALLVLVPGVLVLLARPARTLATTPVDPMRRAGFIASAAAGTLLLASALSSSRGADRRAPCAASLVPAYLHPQRDRAARAALHAAAAARDQPGERPG